MKVVSTYNYTGVFLGDVPSYLKLYIAGQCIRSLTQILTQNGKGAGGSSGDIGVRKHPSSEQTRPEIVKKPPPAPLTAAHNPKVVGSNPAPATTIPSISLEIEGISLFLCTFYVGLFFAFPQDPGSDPYGEMIRKD